jgi:hypothetical protein
MQHIQALAAEEHALRDRESHGQISESDRLRLAEIELELDQSWDLLRQRRARRDAGLDPDQAQPRDIDTVEGYRQ